MEKNRRIYWTITVIMSMYILFTAYFTFVSKEVLIKQFGFPNYFRIELIVAKIAGAVVLLIPQTPARIREWVYVGFSICMISASIAHYFSGDPGYKVILPLVELILFIIGIRYLYKLNKIQNTKVGFENKF